MPAPRKTRRSEHESAERIFNDLIAKRNEQNDKATELRDERDIVHAKKKELIEEMTKLKAERDALNAEMKVHKERRNEFQKKGRTLIERKKSVTRHIDGNLDNTIEMLRLDIRELELKHQTNPSSIEQERDLLEAIRAKQAELEDLQSRTGAQEDLTLEAEGIDSMIDEAFRKADEEHKEVVRLHDEAEKVHKKVVAHIEEINHLNAEGDKKHHQMLESRALADRYHEKAMSMREKLMATRREAREERKRQKEELDEINKAVKDRFESEEAQKEAEDEILKILQQKGRVDLKR
ncbi:MAG: hypothetical protein JSW25_10630 [Thermoplasmata archaeon]|nr:MAG: hypothetical protein JSW25_10630 [Thermoplasmata archaeon]